MSEAGVYQQIVDLSDDAIVCIDEVQRITLFNRGAEVMFDQRASDMLGEPLGILLPPGLGELHTHHVQHFGDSERRSKTMGERGTIMGRRRNGELFPAQATITVVRLSGMTIFSAIIRDLTGLREREAALAEARIRAELAERSKTDFLAHMSHELRTPLNAVIGFSELILTETLGPVGSERYRGYLSDIHSSGIRLLDIVSSLLDSAGLNPERFKLTEGEVSLAEAAEHAVATVQAFARESKIALSVDLAYGPARLRADRRLVQQILLNLLSNAIKFTPPGGQIVIESNVEKSGDAIVAVRDTGIGMSREQIVTARHPFDRAGKAKPNTSVGLGLWFVDTFSRLHGGCLEISSEPGAGTRAAVRFPSRRVMAMLAAVV